MPLALRSFCVSIIASSGERLPFSAPGQGDHILTYALSGSVVRTARPVLATNVLHGLPFFERGFDARWLVNGARTRNRFTVPPLPLETASNSAGSERL
jgi:hypothetical protein